MHPHDLADPHSVVDQWRARGPVVPVSIRAELGFPPIDSGGARQWTTLSFEAARAVLDDDGSTYSVRAYAASHDVKNGAATILSMDEPRHSAHRRLVSSGFFAKRVRQVSEAKVHAVIDRLITDILAHPEDADLVRDLAAVLPIQIIVSLVGVPDEDWPRFLEWIDALVDQVNDHETAMAAGAKVQQYLVELVARRRREPRDDLASTLAVAEVDGERLSDPAIVAFLSVLLTAGGETTVRAIGTTLAGLLNDPRQYAALVADPALVPRALDEGLRWDTPVQTINRRTTRAVELVGVPLDAGDWINVHLGAANRDPARWDDPHRFDMMRPQLPGISFGYGPHYCIGVNLARFEAETALGEIVRRLPGLRLIPGHRATIQGLELRGPKRLPVEFDH